ncbi:MAG: D-alanyl-D-alanine carboxypeptidase/D-alanyl-D-alanine-endopeptidase [Armatimonadota bacterium]|nr:D-alanyl-D-alanine carboxypeptidase/D-alanyl-D-alanine-endopeptidase [Armatimonadota bacterium]
MSRIIRRQYSVLAYISLIFILTIQIACAQNIAKAIDDLLASPALRHGRSGVLIESLRDGKVIYSRNADEVFIPASNMKLLTSAAALDILGPDYRYKTEFYSTGHANGSTLEGDIYIKGGGDPVLRTEQLAEFARMLRKRGIRHISGAVIADETRFGKAGLGKGWEWDDEQYYYATPVGSLNLNENSVQVFVKPDRHIGRRAIVKLEPPTSYFKIRNSAVTVAAGEKASVSVTREHGGRVITVSGQIPLDYVKDGPEERISVWNPALYAATVLKETLRRAKTSVLGRAKSGVTPASAELLYTCESPSLSELLDLQNEPSDNTIAEVLYRSLAYEKEKEPSAVELTFLKKAGVDAEAIAIADGSGLSRHNLVSPSGIVAVLRYMGSHPNSKVFIDSLPIAGVSGTLRNRMNSAAKGNVRAKTGSMTGVSSISGYLTTTEGDPLVFSILMNNHLCSNTEARAIQDKICELLRGL